jgi:hypothetical protein
MVFHAHAVELENGLQMYLDSHIASRIDELCAASRVLSISDLVPFAHEVKALFLPSTFPVDIEDRRNSLNALLQDWNGSDEPFPLLESRLQLLLVQISAVIESTMLEMPQKVHDQLESYDPFNP